MTDHAGEGRLPDFFVVGAPRSGTTSMYRYLQEHPGIYMSNYKEPSFFACGAAAKEVLGIDERLADDVILERSVLTWDNYLAQFEAALPDQLLGEASPTYLYTAHAPAVIARHVPNAKIVACLRQPVERAYSHLSIASEGRDVTADDLASALAEETANPRTILVDRDDYLRPGLYARHVTHWFETFGRDSVHLLRYEQLDQDTAGAMAGIYQFLGVDPSFVPDVSVRYHQSGRYDRLSITHATRRVMPYLQRAVQRLPEGVSHRLAKLRARVHQAERTTTALDPDRRRQLTEKYFADDLAALQRLTDEDYGDWLT